MANELRDKGIEIANQAVQADNGAQRSESRTPAPPASAASRLRI